MRGRLLALSALSVAVLFAATGVVSAIALPMDGTLWAVRELSVGKHTKLLTFHATTTSDGVEFTFPDASASPAGYVSYLTTQYYASLEESNVLTATFVVHALDGNVFVPGIYSGCPGSSSSLCPGNVRLYFESTLPVTNERSVCMGRGVNDNNYWWSSVYYQFVNGGGDVTVTLSVPLDPAHWSNICGKFGSSRVPVFDSAIAKINTFGLSFGAGFFFSNGVGVSGAGTATFELTTYTIS